MKGAIENGEHVVLCSVTDRLVIFLKAVPDKICKTSHYILLHDIALLFCIIYIHTDIRFVCNSWCVRVHLHIRTGQAESTRISREYTERICYNSFQNERRGGRAVRISQACAKCMYDHQVRVSADEVYLAEVRKIIEQR